jgi:hypothetical protein
MVSVEGKVIGGSTQMWAEDLDRLVDLRDVHCEATVVGTRLRLEQSPVDLFRV